MSTIEPTRTEQTTLTGQLSLQVSRHVKQRPTVEVAFAGADGGDLYRLDVSTPEGEAALTSLIDTLLTARKIGLAARSITEGRGGFDDAASVYWGERKVVHQLPDPDEEPDAAALFQTWMHNHLLRTRESWSLHPDDSLARRYGEQAVAIEGSAAPETARS